MTRVIIIQLTKTIQRSCPTIVTVTQTTKQCLSGGDGAQPPEYYCAEAASLDISDYGSNTIVKDTGAAGLGKGSLVRVSVAMITYILSQSNRLVL